MEISELVAFLDVQLTLESDGSLSARIYRKPTSTHEDIYFIFMTLFLKKVNIACTLYKE